MTATVCVTRLEKEPEAVPLLAFHSPDPAPLAQYTSPSEAAATPLGSWRSDPVSVLCSTMLFIL